MVSNINFDIRIDIIIVFGERVRVILISHEKFPTAKFLPTCGLSHGYLPGVYLA